MLSLEEQRQAFEDIECYERMVIASLEKKPKAVRGIIALINVVLFCFDYLCMM
jgi:hypothetical protein